MLIFNLKKGALNIEFTRLAHHVHLSKVGLFPITPSLPTHNGNDDDDDHDHDYEDDDDDDDDNDHDDDVGSDGHDNNNHHHQHQMKSSSTLVGHRIGLWTEIAL